MTAQSQSPGYPGTRAGARPWLPRLTLIVVTILILSNLIAALIAAGYQIYYDGLIYPGVHVWGVDVSGMTPAEAAAALNGQFTYPQLTTITFRDGQNVWPVSAADLGIHFDVERTVQAAYEVGRHPQLIPSLRQQLQAWRQGVVVSPVLVYDQWAAEERLLQVAAAINRPALDATLVTDGTSLPPPARSGGRSIPAPRSIASTP